MIHVGRFAVGLYPSLRVEWKRGFEYWDRYMFGPIYVLAGRRHTLCDELRELSALWRDEALERIVSGPTAMRHCADELDALVAERERP